MGVYGNLLSAFPELYRRLEVWTQRDRSDVRIITGIYIPTSGNKLKRFIFTNRRGLSDYGSSAIDYSDNDRLFIPSIFRDKIHIGDYVHDPDEMEEHRIMGEIDYTHAGGYIIFDTERVTGANCRQDDPLTIKEAQFA